MIFPSAASIGLERYQNDIVPCFGFVAIESLCYRDQKALQTNSKQIQTH